MVWKSGVSSYMQLKDNYLVDLDELLKICEEVRSPLPFFQGSSGDYPITKDGQMMCLPTEESELNFVRSVNLNCINTW